ncbi:MAG TPA: hypothetical protein ENN25_04900 [Euryarchaeota archaeon]|nr:hypothetical protein [Euryarchaeota archaeon]
MTGTRVAVAYESDRMRGARAVVGAIGLPDLTGKKAFIKAIGYLSGESAFFANRRWNFREAPL